MCEASVIVETALWQEMQSIRVRDLVMIQYAMQILRAKDVLEGSFGRSIIHDPDKEKVFFMP